MVIKGEERIGRGGEEMGGGDDDGASFMAT